MLLLRSLREWWSPPAPAPPRTRHDRIIDLVIELVPAGATFRPRDIYRRLLADFRLKDLDTHLWIEVQRPAARIERLGRGVYRVVFTK